MDGWDGMVIIGLRQSKSTFGANKKVPPRGVALIKNECSIVSLC